MNHDNIQNRINQGKRLTRRDALKLFRSDDIFTLGVLADSVAKKKSRGKAYYVRNLHINPTNICVNRCRFCAFSRSMGEKDAYELSVGAIIRKIRRALPIEEVHIVGGLHPDRPFGFYLEMLKKIKNTFPHLHIKAFTAVEVDYMRRISGLSLWEVLAELREHGLGSMPGGGAEIFSSDIRGKLCPEKLSGERWLAVMEAAHRAGVKTNATMLYGHIETYEHRVDHLMRLRELQDKTGGFQAFIPLSYHPGNTDMGGGRLIRNR